LALLVPCLATAASSAAPVQAPTLTIDGLGKGTAPLDGPWQFHLGDNSAWAQPGIDDATGRNGWEQIKADTSWGRQGHPSYTGYAWYRRHLSVATAPGVPSNVVLDIPFVDDAYQLYWNGVQVGHWGSFPPHLKTIVLPGRSFGLGPVRSGVLAVRVFKAPLASNDLDTLGGFEATPFIGSPAAVAAVQATHDYQFLRSHQFNFALASLYALVSVLCLFVWLRDRNQWLLFWMFVFTLCGPIELFLVGMNLPIPWAWLQFGEQVQIQIREVSQWFLLVWLLDLHDVKPLLRFLRWLAVFTLFIGVADGALGFVLDIISAHQFAAWDAIFTAFILPQEAIPAILVVYAILRRRHLDFSRWLVAIAATANAMFYAVSNIAVQGVRFTHWTLADLMNQPHIVFMGSLVNFRSGLRLFLFLTFVYAVLKYAIDDRRRQSALEQEFQNARELQRVLVPETLPTIPGFSLTSAYRPAREVGGDFFQILPLEGGSTLILLGDVSGKGLRAAMAVSLIVGAVRSLSDHTTDPAELLRHLNRHLHGRLQGGFATCIVLRLQSDGTAVLASAGHPAPFLNGDEVDLPGALPIGVAADTAYTNVALSLSAARHFALYTDGLLEARRPTGELYGFTRMQELFSGVPTAAQASDAAVEFGQEDDITVLTLTRLKPMEQPSNQLVTPDLAGSSA
jgi:hypothetical protein